jgi:Icc-related predicted phosphoesterase
MLRDLVEKKQPRLLICGHIHESAGVAEVGATTVVNCSLPRTGQGVMIELEDGNQPVVSEA